ncbi:hypothetical protein CHUAL_003483 [Chamberlinius hualienensis]
MDADKQQKITQNSTRNETVSESVKILDFNPLLSTPHSHEKHRKHRLHHNHPPLNIIKRDISPIKPLPSNTVLPIPLNPYGVSTATVNVNILCPRAGTTTEKKKSVKKIQRPKSLIKIGNLSKTTLKVENSTAASSSTSVEVIQEIPVEVIPITQVYEPKARPKSKPKRKQK